MDVKNARPFSLQSIKPLGNLNFNHLLRFNLRGKLRLRGGAVSDSALILPSVLLCVLLSFSISVSGQATA